jgi:RimJ/RimL family protein N-acetyltransferase
VVARLRAAEPADAQAIAELIARCDATYAEWAPAGWSPPPPPERQVRRRLDDRSAWTRVADRDDRLVGVVSWRRDGDAALLSWLFVEPDEWGSGFADSLLDAALEAMRSAGYAEAELRVHEGNDRARHFYERTGWTLAGERRTHERLGLKLVRYRRVL